MNRQIFVPLRFKILFSLLLGITVVVAIITFTMANLFHKDKTTYINDLISTNTIHTTLEAQSLLQNYVERTRTFARVAYDTRMAQSEKSRMLDDLFQAFTEMLAINFYEDGVRQASILDERGLKEAGLESADLDSVAMTDPPAAAGLEPGEVLIRSASLPKGAPAMVITSSVTVPGRESPLVLEALVRTDELQALVERSDLFDSFILAPGGDILVRTDRDQATSSRFTQWVPDDRLWAGQSSLAATFDYMVDGTDMIGGFGRVETGNLLVGVQIPRTTAYLSARDLFNNLLLVSLVILVGGAIISLIWSHRITLPLERLTSATQEVGRGKFEIQLTPTSRDEIGSLTRSVNQMASELRERDRALAEAQAALIQSEKMSAFGQLSAGIAHEVKNPLAGILGYTQLSLKKIEDDTPIYKNLTIIEKETRRCNTIIENLMKFARQDKPVLKPLNLNDVVEDAMTLVDHQMGLNQVQLASNLAEDLPGVMGDPNQLIQVFMNIFINAQQAMDGKPGTVTVTTLSAEPGTLEVRIQDTGPGMAMEQQDKIFEPFFTTKEAGKGTGLGLAVTYGIVRDHGGTITVDSSPGQGATFVITLPAAASLPVEAEDHGEEPPGDAAVGDQAPTGDTGQDPGPGSE